MEIYLFFIIVAFFKGLSFDNPALMDLLKVLVGSTMWIGGMVAYLYSRERRTKTAHINK